MNKVSIAAIAALLAIASSAQAQTRTQDLSPTTEIRESTDPSTVAEVERRAADIMSRQQSGNSMGASSGSSDAATGDMHRKQRRHDGKAHRSKSESRSGSQ